MKEFLEIKMEGWSATPRLPFILSGNAVCIPTPSYSLLLGLIGCCLGRIVTKEETGIGFKYEFDTNAKDLEKRQRLILDGNKIKEHGKGSDAYSREFHVKPKLTLWLDRLDWENYFHSPIGTPCLGRSQDILEIKRKSIRIVKGQKTEFAEISGCMIPFEKGMRIGGQLVQIAESYQESNEIGKGRIATNSRIFMAVPHDSKGEIRYKNLYQIENEKCFYFHQWD